MSHYSHIINGCMNVQFVRPYYKIFHILLDIGFIPMILKFIMKKRPKINSRVPF